MLRPCLRVSLVLSIALLMAAPSPGQDKKPAHKYMEVELGDGVKMKLVHIEAGKFMRGSPNDEEGRYNNEGPQHEVEITKAFYMGVYPVTQAEYEKVISKNPSDFSEKGLFRRRVAGLDTSKFPVDHVSWDDAVEFCRKLGQKERKKFDLPTEAEWEYACRAGSTGPFHHGKSLSSTQANFDGDFPYGGADKGPWLRRTTRVGSYAPNPFGLYDMHGNVWQWCSDWYKSDYYRDSPRRDPQGPSQEKADRLRKGGDRVLRGGSLSSAGRECRSACRSYNRGHVVGFRVVMRLP